MLYCTEDLSRRLQGIGKLLLRVRGRSFFGAPAGDKNDGAAIAGRERAFVAWKTLHSGVRGWRLAAGVPPRDSGPITNPKTPHLRPGAPPFLRFLRRISTR